MTPQEDINNARKSSLAGTTFAVLEMAHQEGVGELVAAKLGEIAGLIYGVTVSPAEVVGAYYASIKAGNFQPVERGEDTY